MVRISTICDGICLLQQFRHPLLTFSDASEAILQRITSKYSTKILFVTDQYFEQSSKSYERDKIVFGYLFKGGTKNFQSS